MADRHVRFALGDEAEVPYALQLRLTPQMLAAIRSSSAAGAGPGTSQQQQQQHSIQLDLASKKAVVSVNGEEYHFKTLPDQGCSVIKIDKEQGVATTEGSITQKMLPVRTVAGTAASLAATAAAAASGKPTEGIALLPSTLPLLSPLDSQKPLPPSNTIEDPAILNQSRDSLAEAAAKRGRLRLVLISLLANRPALLGTIKRQLSALQQSVSGFKYPQGKGELELALKKVGEYKPPGNYILFSGLESELEPLIPEAEAIQATREKKHAKVGAVAGQSKPEKLKQKPASSSPIKNLKKRSRPTSSPEITPRTTATGNEEEKVSNAPSLSPAARRKITPSLPSSSPNNSQGNDEDGGTITVTAASRPLSSSSRGSGGADESWVLEHAHRHPEPAPLLTTAADYHTANAEFQRRYLIYFKLHQLLSANRRDFEALQAAVDDAPSVQEKEVIEGEVERLWARRARRSRNWEAAFKVLHEELAEWKNALSAYASALNNTNNDSEEEEEPSRGGDDEVEEI